MNNDKIVHRIFVDDHAHFNEIHSFKLFICSCYSINHLVSFGLLSLD